MPQSDLKMKSKAGLRFQYIVSAIIVASLFFLGSLLVSIYFSYATDKNASYIELHKTISSYSNDLRNALWEADKSISVLLRDSEASQNEDIKQRLDNVSLKLNILKYAPAIELVGLTPNIDELELNEKQLQQEVQQLLTLRQDSNWLFPILPLINSTLTKSSNEFETALNQALLETNGTTNKYAIQAHYILDELKNTWRLQRLEFRGALIRYAGLNIINRSQEKNIDDFSVIVSRELKQLEELSKKHNIGLQTSAAISLMRESSQRWYTEYNELLRVKNNSSWRSDVEYVRSNIQPIQNKIFNELEKLDKTLDEWAVKNTQKVDAAGQQIHYQLWFLTGVVVLFVIIIYYRFNKILLRPLEYITHSIEAHSADSENLVLPEQSSKEINILVNAFNNMRKQVHHRQMVLEFQAMHDSLTGLPNRSLLQDRLEQGIKQAERTNGAMSLLLLDLDRFKDINDTLGHPVGDIVLRQVSKRLEECLRSSDTVARLGGDEFAILTTYSERTQIESFINRIIKAVEKVIIVEEQKLHVGMSVGIASYPSDGIDADTLIQHADIAMYSAKRENKNHEFYDPEKDYYSADNLTLLADLKSEFKKPTNQLQLFFQPLVDLQTGKVSSVESLIRWKHPEHGFLPTEEIINMAEHTGLITELTYWVLRESITEFAKWCKYDLTLSVNLSAWNLQDPELIPFILGVLKTVEVPVEKITLEITESAVMNDPVMSRNVLKKLDELGFNLAIDDYGTGFSSLAYLKLLPVTSLKIDKSFVVDMLDSEDDAIIVHSTIELAHNLGLNVIAEGVENKETLKKLKAQGCDKAQGYYIAEPMPCAQLKEWFSDFSLQE